MGLILLYARRDRVVPVLPFMCYPQGVRHTLCHIIWQAAVSRVNLLLTGSRRLAW